MDYTCKNCQKEFSTIKGLGNHRFQKHGIKPQVTYNEYILDGESYKCKCGCGETPKFLSITKGYRDYVKGHHSRIKNNWGHNPEAQKKSKETQRKMYENGDLVIWNKGLTKDDPRVHDYIEKMRNNPERNRKISELKSGTHHSEEAKNKLKKRAKERWSDPKEREKQSHRKMVWLRENDFTIKSSVEEKFNDMLQLLDLKENVNYERQYYVRDIKGFFDFKLFDTNTLIEVDGDFWHCNPKTNPKVIYEHQRKNLEKDEIKNKWCKENNVKLLRFWENDINNNPEWVIKEIKKHVT